MCGSLCLRPHAASGPHLYMVAQRPSYLLTSPHGHLECTQGESGGSQAWGHHVVARIVQVQHSIQGTGGLGLRAWHPLLGAVAPPQLQLLNLASMAPVLRWRSSGVRGMSLGVPRWPNAGAWPNHRPSETHAPCTPDVPGLLWKPAPEFAPAGGQEACPSLPWACKLLALRVLASSTNPRMISYKELV